MRFTLLSALFLLLSLGGHAQKNWKVFTSDEGAFSIDLPGVPQINTISRQSEGVQVKVHMHMVSSDAGTAYALYNDFETGINILDENAYLNEVSKEMAIRMNLDTASIEEIEFDGYPGRQFHTELKDGTAELKVILRNNRAYIIGAFFPSKKKDGLKRVMSSFKLLPYKKPSWVSYQSTEYLFKADFPSQPVQETEAVEGMELLAFYGKNINSGDNLSLAVQQYSPYDQFESDSLILADRVNAYLEDGDSIFSQRDIIVDGRPGKDVVFQQGSNHFQLRMRTFNRGMLGYILFAFLSPSEINSETTNHFFESFHFIGEPQGDLLADKGPLLLKDIASPDTAVWRKVQQAFSLHTFEERDRETIQALIKRSFSDDADSSDTRKEILLEALQEIHSEKSIAFIESVFPTLHKNPYQEVAALSVLVKINTEQSLAVLAKLLAKHTPLKNQQWRYYSIFSPYAIDSVLQKKYLLSTLKLLPVKEYKPGLYNMAEQLLQNKMISIKELTPYKKLVLQDFNDDIKTYFQDSTYNSLTSLIEILGYEECSPKEIASLQKVATSHEGYIQTVAATTLLRLNKVPEKNVVDTLARKLATRSTFYTELRDHAIEKKFPKAYATQDSLAVGELYDYLSSEYDIADNLKIVYKTERDHEGAPGKFYVIKFYDPADQVWYLGVAGPYAGDKISLAGSLTGSDYTADEDVDYSEYLTEYIKQISEELE